MVYFCISKYVNNVQDAEELTSDVFTNFFNHLENIDEKRSIKYYLMTSAKNISIDFLRKKKINYVYTNEVDFYQEVNQTNYFDYQKLLDEMSNVVNEQEIKIILDHQLYGLQFKEIALNLSTSVNTIKSIYRRAIIKIQKVYQGGKKNG